MTERYYSPEEMSENRSRWLRSAAASVTKKVSNALNVEVSVDASLFGSAAIVAMIAARHAAGDRLGSIHRDLSRILGSADDSVIPQIIWNSVDGHLLGYDWGDLVWLPDPAVSTWLALAMNGSDHAARLALEARWGALPGQLSAAREVAVGADVDWRSALCRLPGFGDRQPTVPAEREFDNKSAVDFRDNAPLVAVLADLEILAEFPEASSTWQSLITDIEKRHDALTPLEQRLLKSRCDGASWSWGEYAKTRNLVVLSTTSNGYERGGANSLPIRVDSEHHLIPDWLLDDVFSAGRKAGIAEFGTIAYAWVRADLDRSTPGDLAPLAMLLDPDMEADRNPPPLAVHTGPEANPYYVNLLLRDGPECWQWLAVAQLTGRIRVDAVEVDDGSLRIVDVANTATGQMLESLGVRVDLPDGPAHFTDTLAQEWEDGLLGGLQAAEDSKSRDVLTLIGARSREETDALRLEVLDAEAERAHRLWSTGEDCEKRSRSAWTALQDAEAVHVAGNSREGWLNQLTAVLADERCAVVHLAAREYLEAFWAAPGGRVGRIPFSRSMSDLEAVVAPFAQGGVLHLPVGHSPVDQLLEFAAPMARTLRETAMSENLEHLLIVGFRAAHLIPWDVVELPEGAGSFGEHLRISVAPAVSLVSRPSVWASPSTVTTISAHGASLPWADADASAVASLYPRQVSVPDGSSRERSLAAMSGAEVLHVCGHAEAHLEPLASALLAGEPHGHPERVISAADIQRHVDLSSCQLVVLSACRSGAYAGKLRTFENHTGIDTAFLAAGASAVVSTLWPVEDFSAMLMSTLIHAGFTSGRSGGEALASARRAFRDGLTSKLMPARAAQALDTAVPAWRGVLDSRSGDYRKPYFWASWRLTGWGWR